MREALTIRPIAPPEQAGRALYDKLAEHRGFIVYAHEL